MSEGGGCLHDVDFDDDRSLGYGAINLLAPEFYIYILAHPVYTM
jgi:hypothetical protein